MPFGTTREESGQNLAQDQRLLRTQ